MTKKQINSKAKGNRAELELVNIFNERFGKGMFARVGVASGARIKNTKLPEKAVDVMTGDLITPEGFKFSIECKAENVNIDFLAKSEKLEKWLRQASDDARRVGKMPMLCWKPNRKGWIVALPARGPFRNSGSYSDYYVRYGYDVQNWGWVILRLDALLEANQEHEFWFNKSK